MTLTDKAASFARTETEEGTVGDVPEMVERVARAMVLDHGGDPDKVLSTYGGSAPLWTFYVPAARAAIAAVREPTARMIAEGESAASFGIGKPNDTMKKPFLGFGSP